MHWAMRNIHSITLLLILSVSAIVSEHATAQYNLDYGFCIGTGNYLGDIGGLELEGRDFFADLHLNQTRLSSHVYVRYRLTRLFAIRGQVGVVSLQDSDALTTYPNRAARNANFRNFLKELSFRTELTFFQRPLITRYTSRFRAGMNAYASLGITAFNHSPEAQLDFNAIEEHFNAGRISQASYEQLTARAENGDWIALQPLQTEGVDYGLNSLGFPLGGGVSFIVNNKFRLGLEFNWNLTLTDYLDDVSGTYANPSTLQPEGIVLSSPSSQALMNSLGITRPLQDHQYNPNGDYTIRGNPDKNDSYGTLQLTVSNVIRGSSRFRDYTYGKRRRYVKRKPPRPGTRGIGRGRAKF